MGAAWLPRTSVEDTPGAHVKRTIFSLALVVGLFPLGCDQQQRLAADGDVQADHDEDRVSVVGSDTDGDGVRGSVSTLAPGDCIIVGDDCINPDAAGTFCEREGGPYDIIVADGEVVEVICYPPAAGDGDPTLVVEAGGGAVSVPQNENNTTVTFDEGTNGTAIEGDLVVDGNNVAVYGNGVDETVIRGNVILDGNNVRLRGLTIDGNLTLEKNNLAAVFVKVTGDVIINGNNCVFAGSDVFGDLTVTANNVTLVQNVVQGDFNADGNSGACTDNHAFSDANDDGSVTTDEIGDDLGCG